MVRMARVHVESEFAPAGFAELAKAGALNLLQLDYARPRLASVVDDEPPELPEVAASFPTTVRSLCATLFLEPDFRVVTSAGWSNSYRSVENVARALVAGGSPEVPVSAVRGSNLLGILDLLIEGGLPLDNVNTGAPWRTFRGQVLAADLQLGAGPILTALQEGGRVVVAGCYDGAAPTIAAAVHAYQWSWKELDHLAGAAAAARAAIWPHGHASESLAAAGALPATHIHPRIELAETGNFTLELSQPANPSDAQRLIEWLQTVNPGDSVHRQADVAYDARHANVAQTGPTQLGVTGFTGSTASGHWRLDILYLAGFLAETMIEFSAGTAPSLRRQTAEAFRTHFIDADNERSFVSVQELTPTGQDAGGASWLHLVCRSWRRQLCTDFAAHVSRLASSNADRMRLPAGRPLVHAECGLWPADIPRDAVDVAIDTRPAKEWD